LLPAVGLVCAATVPVIAESTHTESNIFRITTLPPELRMIN